MFRHLLLILAAGCVLFAFVSPDVAAEDRDAALSLVPQPSTVERKPGSFTLKENTSILILKGIDAADAANVARQLADRLNRSTGWTLQPQQSDDGKPVTNAIVLSISSDTAFLRDSYTLDVNSDRVLIAAGNGAGLFYGMQTLLQLLPPEVFSPTKVEGAKEWKIPCVHISDQPRFHWRGLLLDVARHFFTKEEMKKYIDVMAQHKLNMLQLHLTDDVGWRIEIKKYPKLTEIGAWRNGIGYGLDPKSSTAYGPDGRYGGFYTQDDIREIIAYAKDRYITIVPEIEMPGHAGGALSVYPEFSCTGGPFERDTGAMGIFCPGNDAGIEFLENVLKEIAQLFPGKYIHVGGDEVGRELWSKCPKCQARIKQENLKDVKELQSYFTKRIERCVNALGKTMIGWDEIIEGGLAPNAVVMSWRSVESAVAAAGAGHDVVMSPTSHCYFDYSQEPKDESANNPFVIPLEKVYSFEPMPQGLPADKAQHILGAAGTLWTESMPNVSRLQYMTFPRACALAEVTWSDPKSRQWEDFRTRLETHLKRLKAQGVNYRKP